MPNVNIVRLSDSDIERLAAALAERVGLPLTEIATRLSAIEARLAEKRAGREEGWQEESGGDLSEISNNNPTCPG